MFSIAQFAKETSKIFESLLFLTHISEHELLQY